MFLHLATDDERIPGDMIAHTRSDALMESILDTLHIVANQMNECVVQPIEPVVNCSAVQCAPPRNSTVCITHRPGPASCLVTRG